MDDPIVIVGYSRTPMGSFQGELAAVTAPMLGTVAIQGALQRAKLAADQVDEVIMGCVLPAGLGQAPARQAALGADILVSAGCTTINKMCGSGMKAVLFAHDLIKAGSGEVMVAGGFESMTNAPYLLSKARGGYRLGHGQLYDHMFLDGLEDAYEKGQLMGVYAERTAEKYKFTREQQDEFALRSLARANQAIEDGSFSDEITPVTVKTRKGENLVATDQGPLSAKPDKIPNLRPAFKQDGTVTAANSSSISDGGAALVLMRQSKAKELGLQPIAKILAHSTQSQEPDWFTTAPIGAIEKVYQQTGWTAADVDLFEINEAFAVVTMAAMQDLNLAADKVNIHGGACALGHPVGASGARIIVTLLSALQKYKKQRGIAALCIGGGEANAIAVELI